MRLLRERYSLIAKDTPTRRERDRLSDLQSQLWDFGSQTEPDFIRYIKAKYALYSEESEPPWILNAEQYQINERQSLHALQIALAPTGARGGDAGS
jgi:hypothetical protein